MERDHWQQIEKILDKALAFNTLKEQEHYAREACKDNKQLFMETLLLIRSIHDAEKIRYLEEE